MRHRFAEFELDEVRHQLTRAGAPVKIEPLVFDMLRVLVRNAGELITRERLIEDIWKGRIVSESAISACLAAARGALGDSGKRQAMIRTVPRRGVVFVAEVERVGAQGVETSDPNTDHVQRVRFIRNKEGRRLAYALTGGGPPVLYMRLSGAANLEVEWNLASGKAFFGEVAERFSVLRYDPVGAGLSDRSAVETDFGRIADDAMVVADACGIDRFGVYSTSGGVLPAAHLAARYPQRISRLAIIGGYVDGRVRRGNPNQTDVIRELIANGWDEPESAFATAVLASYFPEGPFDVVKEMVRLMQSSMTPDHMMLMRDAINNASIEPLLERIVCPTLIMHGRKDGVHPVSEAQKLATGIRSSELVIMDTANHLPLPGSPAWRPFMGTLMNFLA